MVIRSAEGGHRHHHLSVEASRVHWGYFSRSLQPQIEINSGDTIAIETLTQHASDDPARMIANDVGAESVFAGRLTRRMSIGAAPDRWMRPSTVAALAKALAFTSAPAQSR
jgi:hypothetical protein